MVTTPEARLLAALRAVKARDGDGDGDGDVDVDPALDAALLESMDAALAAVGFPGDRCALAHELAWELADWDILGASNRKRRTQTELLVRRWELLGVLLASDGVGAAEELAAGREVLLARIDGDRFAATDVQAVIARCLIGGLDRGVFSLRTTIDYLKQFYVTLSDLQLRAAIVTAIDAAVKTKDDVKALLLSTGFVRAQLQVALDSIKVAHGATESGEDDKHDEDDGGADSSESVTRVTARDVAAWAVQQSTTLLHRVALLTCTGYQRPQYPAPSEGNALLRLGGSIVQLLLSRVTAVCEEAIRLLHLLVDWVPARELLVTLPDLRGALDKARLLATKPDFKPTIQDPFVRDAAMQLARDVLPLIDAYERRHGSVMGLPAEEISTTASSEGVQEQALVCKSRGNAYYQRGNIGAARYFYRRAIAIVRSAELREHQRLQRLPEAEILAACTIGASVQVSQRDGSLRSAMVSDVEDGHVEVLYDGGDDEECVPVSRITLRMNTHVLEQLKTIVVDCAMNMGKALTQLHDYEGAIGCFTHALEQHPHYIAALYHRGVTYMASHDLKAAQTDLWNANHLCRQWKTLGNADEAKKKSALHSQITSAYKRLQVMHANKKKLDKKVIKQMVKYLSTIPGLQEE